MNIRFLNKFIKQSKSNSLKTKDLYPESIFDLDLKVKFGTGAPSKTPFIAVLGSGMSVRNGYYPAYLFYKSENILVLAFTISETNPFGRPWNKDILENHKKIKETIEGRYGESFIFKKYEVEISGSEVKYSSDGVDVSEAQMLEAFKTIVETYKQCLDNAITKDTSSDLSKGLFYMERQLEDFIIQNWEGSELGKKYDLIYEEGELKSQQYPTDIGRIDILAKDKADGSHVVIELKRNQTSDDTVGQIARYMGWVKEKLGDEKVKGIIIAGKYDEKLFYALGMVRNIEVFLYEVEFRLNEYKIQKAAQPR